MSIVPIVEGHSEVDSVQVLLRRVLADFQRTDVVVAPAFRVKRGRLVREGSGELERAVQLAIRTRPNPGCVLLLLDADDDCPAELGPSLLERCQRMTAMPVAVVLAKREFEGWFLGAKESLRGVRGIRSDVEAPPNPEDIRGAKEQLSSNMERGRTYNAVLDQPALADKMDLDLARQRCPSFDKFLRDVERLLQQIQADRTKG